MTNLPTQLGSGAMHEVNTVNKLAELLSSSYRTAAVIGIDGTDGVGKTTLAKKLGELIGATVVSLDEFIIENRGTYVPNLRINDLRVSISLSGRRVIVEGVCLLATLGRLSLEADVLIYVKRVADCGHWYDENTCDPQEAEEPLIKRLSQDAAQFARLEADLSGEPPPQDDDAIGLTPLREEIIRYHCRYRPSRRAQILFLRIVCNREDR